MKALSLGELLQKKGIDTATNIAGMTLVKIVPDENSSNRFGMMLVSKDGKTTKTVEVGRKVLEMGIVLEDEATGEMTIADGFEIAKIDGRDVAIKTGSNNRASKFNFA